LLGKLLGGHKKKVFGTEERENLEDLLAQISDLAKIIMMQEMKPIRVI
jgi:hypothetical protein